MQEFLQPSGSSSKSVFWLCVLVVYCGTVVAGGVADGKPEIPAVIVFGDSIVDAGNNNKLKTLARCNFPPYGRDFQGGVATGRFSNGKIPSDFIAEELGIKELVPAYLDPNLQPKDLLTGVTFASGGVGYDPLTSKYLSAISLSDQLGLFKEYAEKVKGMVGEEEKNRLLRTAVVLVLAGTNDIDNSYFLSGVRKSQLDISSYTHLLVDFASDFAKQLHGVGVRRIGVFGIPAIGCLPSARTLGGGRTRNCSSHHNEAAQLFNTRLSAELEFLNFQFPDATFAFIDTFNPLLHLIQHPSQYGFEIVDKGCCGTGKGPVEGGIFCNKLSPNTCKNVSGYLFWDAFHPTETAYQILSSIFVDKIIHSFLPVIKI